MGRESEGEARFHGETGYVLALLEPGEIILRRGIKARVPRAGITGWRADGDDLVIATAEGPLTLTLGAKEAAAWIRALEKPVPTLAEKLGIGPRARVFVLGDISDPDLAVALVDAIAAAADEASACLAVISDEAHLATARDFARRHAALPVWCVYRKGKVAVGDAAVRGAFRDMGWIDTKSCAVSDRLTATRYVRRKS